MEKRAKCSVRWSKDSGGFWAVEHKAEVGPNVMVATYLFSTKAKAEREARSLCLRLWKKSGLPCELYLYNKNGKLGKGSRSRSTYGNDPRRTKG